jgi:7,8-dihydroneopterin aldolase/epimerase/oxygenase
MQTTVPTLQKARRIFLRNLEVRMSLGIHSHEKEAPQRVLVNVELYLDPEARIERDSIRETVDYDFLRDAVFRLAQSGHFHLQETFCERLLAMCLENSEVRAARVSSEKPDVYPDCEAVGFEIFAVK